MTTAQAGFPTIPSEDEIHTTQDLQLGRPTARHLHPEISAFIGRKHDDILSQNRSPSVTELKLLEVEREWGTGDIDTDTIEEFKEMETQDHILWEPNPPPLMVNHPPRITESNTKIQLREGALDKPCPKGEDDLGWVQIQQKSLMWEEKIGDFSETWGPSPATLPKIQESCKSQERLEESNKLTPTRQILLTLKETWNLERIHGLPTITGPVFFPSVSKNEEYWWGSKDPRTVYMWDSMGNQDKQKSLAVLQETENWVVWKTRDKTWTHTLTREDFHQFLSFHKNEKKDVNGLRVKRW
jgi:hypothetical protein